VLHAQSKPPAFVVAEITVKDLEGYENGLCSGLSTHVWVLADEQLNRPKHLNDTTSDQEPAGDGSGNFQGALL
jgi:hypothetical protein